MLVVVPIGVADSIDLEFWIPGTFCGNGLCDGGETCSSCSIDCGQCPSSSNGGGGTDEGPYGSQGYPGYDWTQEDVASLPEVPNGSVSNVSNATETGVKVRLSLSPGRNMFPEVSCNMTIENRGEAVTLYAVTWFGFESESQVTEALRTIVQEVRIPANESLSSEAVLQVESPGAYYCNTQLVDGVNRQVARAQLQVLSTQELPNAGFEWEFWLLASLIVVGVGSVGVGGVLMGTRWWKRRNRD